jgi:myosin heavy subunit
VWDGKEKPTSTYPILKGYIIYDIEKGKSYFKSYFGGSQGDYYLGIDLNNKESIKVCVATWKDVVEGKYIKKEEVEKKIQEAILPLKKTIGEKDRTIENLNNQIETLTKQNLQLNEENKTLNDYKEKYGECSKKLEDLTIEYREYKIKFEKVKEEWLIKEQGYLKQIKTLQTKYEATKSPIKKLLIDYIFGKT